MKWRAAARLPPLPFFTDQTILEIWRENIEQNGTYIRTNLTIELGTCGTVNQTLKQVGKDVYECELSDELQLPVQAGDIIGLEIPRNRRRAVRLFFNMTTDLGPENYEFMLTSSNTSVDLSDATTLHHALPLLALTVVPNVSTAMTTSSSNNGNNMVTMATTDPVKNTSTTMVDLNSQNNDTDTRKNTSKITPAYITMIALLVGTGLMPAIIIALVLALVCSIRKNRKLKKQVTRRQTNDKLTSSVEAILSDGGGEIAELSTSTGMSIFTKENVAYGKRKRSDGYAEYVINDLVYATIDECDHQQFQIELGSPNSYISVLEPTTAVVEQES